MIGISCPNPDDNTYKQIRDMLDANGFNNVKIFRNNIPPSNKDFHI